MRTWLFQLAPRRSQLCNAAVWSLSLVYWRLSNAVREELKPLLTLGLRSMSWHHRGSGVVSCDAEGASCMLVSKHVLVPKACCPVWLAK